MGNEAQAREIDRMKMRGRIMRRSASFNVAHAVDDLGTGTGAQSIQRALSLLGLVGIIGSENPNGALLGEIFNNALAVGDRHPLGIGAGSLAIMTQFTDAEVDAFFDDNARILAERYPKVSVPALKEIVRRGRHDGFVHNPGLFAQGSWAIGVPVKVAGRKPQAALSIASIEERMTGARVYELAGLLHHEARLIADAVSSLENQP